MLEAVKVKILLLGEESHPTSIQIELTSENDLFFHYSHTMEDAGFRIVQATLPPKADVGLMWPLSALPMVCVCARAWPGATKAHG